MNRPVAYKVRYDGSTLGLYIYVFFILTGLLAPLGIMMILDNLSIYEPQRLEDKHASE